MGNVTIIMQQSTTHHFDFLWKQDLLTCTPEVLRMYAPQLAAKVIITLYQFFTTFETFLMNVFADLKVI